MNRGLSKKKRAKFVDEESDASSSEDEEEEMMKGRVRAVHKARSDSDDSDNSSDDDDNNNGNGDDDGDADGDESEDEDEGGKEDSTEECGTGDEAPEGKGEREIDSRFVIADAEGTNEKEKKKKAPNNMSKMKKEALKYREKLASRGVIYLSRVPPFMKPNKLRQLLTPYGEITRLFLQEEDASARKRRKANGGNGSKQFTEGWIEYSDKKVARQVANMLNNTRVGTKKSDMYYDDLWNLKYLKGFKWDFLTEKLAYERRIRESKLRAKMTESRKRNAAFAEQVEKNKAHKFAAERRSKEGRERGGDGDGDGGEGITSKKKRRFRQERVLASQHGQGQAKVSSAVLGDVFS